MRGLQNRAYLYDLRAQKWEVVQLESATCPAAGMAAVLGDGGWPDGAGVGKVCRVLLPGGQRIMRGAGR